MKVSSGRFALAAHLEQLERLRLDALGGVEHHDRGVGGRQHPVGVLGEVAVARGVEQVEHVVAVRELQHRRGDGDAALLLHLHPVGGDPPPLAARLHRAGRLHRPAVEEELLREGRLAGVGVADDREGAPAGGLLGRGWASDQYVLRWCRWAPSRRTSSTHFDEHGFVRLPGFADAATCEAMLDDVIAVTRAQADGTPEPEALVLPEANLVGRDGSPEELASKVFKLHRRGVFEAFSRRDDVLDRVAELIGPQLDCFLSQFIFKNPGAWGQPWHQDSWYFPFEPARPITGVWLAVTAGHPRERLPARAARARTASRCTSTCPTAGPTPTTATSRSSTTTWRASVPVLMDPGDLLLFDSHLMHRSTDNESDGVRAAMVYHYCATGTVERTKGLVNDFVTVRP